MRRWMLIAVLALMPGLMSEAVAQDNTVEAANTTSPREKLDFASEAITEMDDAVKQTEKLQEQVTREGDEDIIQCVRIKLASIKALADVSERANDSMTDALADGNDERAEHEFRKIAIALSKVRQFVAEAEACVGQGGAVDGDTDVTVDVQGITDDTDDTEGTDTDGEIIGDDPPNTSPFE